MSTAAKSGESAPAKRGRLPLVIGVVVLFAAGGGDYWWWSQRAVVAAQGTGHGAAAAAAHDAPGERGAEPASLLPLETFTVNLADQGGTHFLRVNVQLVLKGEESAKEIEEDRLVVARARASVLDLLATQNAATLVTTEGKDALKKSIGITAAKALHHEVVDVLFSDFVVQF